MLTWSFAPINAMNIDPEFFPYTFWIILNFFEFAFEWFKSIFPYLLWFWLALFFLWFWIKTFWWLLNYFFSSNRRPKGSEDDPFYYIKEDKPVYYVPWFFAKMPKRLQALFIRWGTRDTSHTDEITLIGRNSKKPHFIDSEDPFSN